MLSTLKRPTKPRLSTSACACGSSNAASVFRIEKHVHKYPHCWRTDKPVLYYPLDSWFIRSTAVRERLMAANETIKWKPASTVSGRFGKWLETFRTGT